MYFFHNNWNTYYQLAAANEGLESGYCNPANNVFSNYISLLHRYELPQRLFPILERH
jgi:hypothetical protein